MYISVMPLFATVSAEVGRNFPLGSLTALPDKYKSACHKKAEKNERITHIYAFSNSRSRSLSEDVTHNLIYRVHTEDERII